MLALSELKRIALKEGVPQAIVEKDYALSVALKAFAQSQAAASLVFKGGTAIRKIYFENARFSEDIDFNVIGLGKDECLKLLKETLEGRQIDGVGFGNVLEERSPEGLKAAIKYTGPLAHAQRIRFDFNFRSNFAGKPQNRQLLDTYGIGSAQMQVLGIEELFAEKIHALCCRIAPRDLYDAWFFLKSGISKDPILIEKKFAYYDEKYDIETLEGKIESFREDWVHDLRQLLRKVPDFDLVADETLKMLKERQK